ncbi:MAG TPA: HlyD family efflux transporter periplasmic adaptor subunit [Blastocatellia bacterium]|nr:HlyD family efflux transporter periplasmic adaptor subunit [Blastocatellia bacterium]
MKSRFRKTLILAAAAIAVVGAAASWKYFASRQPSDTLVFSGTVEADEIHIGSRVGGRISAVLVQEGQLVKQDQPLVRFEAYDLESRRNESRASLEEAQANLTKLLAGSRPEEIAEARAQAEAALMNLELARNGPRKEEVEAAREEMKAADADYEIAQLSLERIQTLAANGVVSQQDLDTARTTAERARARFESARQRYDLLRAGTRREEIDRAERQFREASARKDLVERGPRKEDIDAARAQVERLRAALKVVETQTSELEVRSSVAAFVEVLRVRPGDIVAPGGPVATLIEVNRMWVRVFVPEPVVGDLSLDQEATVRVDSGKTFAGRIENIATRGEFTPRNVQTREERTHQVFGVRVQIKGEVGEVRPGMAADVIISRGRRS